MNNHRSCLPWMFLATIATLLTPPLGAVDSERSTRVTDPKMHARSGPRSYPYRTRKDYILKELDLAPGDVVVDIGAGDGWWSKYFAEEVGPEGKVHAAEVEEKKVKSLQERFSGVGQVRSYLCDPDDVLLDEASCDLAFLSQSFHHLDLETRVDYLRRLGRVVKPTGRLVVIEKYSAIATRNSRHGTSLSVLLGEAEEAGWIPVRCELMVGTYHYLAIFVKKDLFPRDAGGRRGGGDGRGRRRRF